MASPAAVLEDKLEALQAERADLIAKATEEGSFATYRERIDQIDTEYPELKADHARVTATLEKVRRMPAPEATEDGPITPVGQLKPLAGPLSQQFLDSEDWRAYVAQRAPSGKFGNGRIEGPKVPIAGSIMSFLQGRRTIGAANELITGASSTLGGAFITPSQSGIYDEGTFQRELTVLDLITRGTADSDAVEFVRAVSFTNLAATVAEADDIATTDDTGRKPWSQWTFERVQPGVKIIAHGAAITKNALADAGQVRTIVESDLRYGLREELEDQILSGQGSGEDFDGILAEATGAQAFSNSVIETLRKAKTLVRTEGRTRANGIVLNPEDAERLDIELLNDAAAYYRAATITEAASIWGLPIVESEGITAGTGIVADFRRAVLWERQAATIEATQGYMDFFMKNLVAILAEMRAAFGVIRPAAFIVVDLGS